MKRGKQQSKNSEPEIVEAGSGNVFADLGLPEPDQLLAKAELVQRICDIIDERNLTQAQAAALLDVDPSQLSALMRGSLDAFSTERLFRFLNALDQEVKIIIRPVSKRAGRAATKMVIAR